MMPKIKRSFEYAYRVLSIALSTATEGQQYSFLSYIIRPDDPLLLSRDIITGTHIKPNLDIDEVIFTKSKKIKKYENDVKDANNNNNLTTEFIDLTSTSEFEGKHLSIPIEIDIVDDKQTSKKKRKFK